MTLTPLHSETPRWQHFYLRSITRSPWPLLFLFPFPSIVLAFSLESHAPTTTYLCVIHSSFNKPFFFCEWSSTAAWAGLCFLFFLMTSSKCILDFHPMEEWECLSCMSMNCQHLKVWRGCVRLGQCDSEAMGSVDWVSARMFAHTVNTPAVVFGLHHVLSCLDEPLG